MVLVSFIVESNLALPWVPEIFFPRVTRGFVGRRSTRLRRSAEDTSGEAASKNFSRGSLFKTWPKPETAHEKSLAPRVTWRKRQLKMPRFSGNLQEGLIPECFVVF